MRLPSLGLSVPQIAILLLHSPRNSGGMRTPASNDWMYSLPMLGCSASSRSSLSPGSAALAMHAIRAAPPISATRYKRLGLVIGVLDGQVSTVRGRKMNYSGYL